MTRRAAGRGLLLALLAVLAVSCARPPIPPAEPPVAPVPVTPEEPDRDEPPGPAVPLIQEETLTPPAPPSPAAERLSIPEIIERQKDPRRKAALSLVEDALVHLEAGNLDHAVTRLEKAMGLAPASGYAHYYMARVRHAQGRENQALVFCGQAYVKLLPEDRHYAARALALRGEVYLALRQPEKARADCEAALVLDPGNEDALALKERL